ncbi:MAG: helix-turn-helix domain-containing protein [Deltaproteobacteria bacterium]|jgi:transposase|nr:helix-turn-helix domain-containing protein [Deltaproteobacteria bacterium]
MNIIYKVVLNNDEKLILEETINKTTDKQQLNKRAQALWHCNAANKNDQEIGQILGLNPKTIRAIRTRFVKNGFTRCLNGRPRSGKPPVISHEDKARLIALACQTVPSDGRPWSLRRLKEKFATDRNTHLSHETIRKILKKAKIARRVRIKKKGIF